jgi:hypothetical protein
MFRILDRAVLRHDLPAHRLLAGDIGTVVFDYDGEAYEVEFMTADGDTIAVETLRADEIEPLNGDLMLHARRLPVA